MPLTLRPGRRAGRFGRARRALPLALVAALAFSAAPAPAQTPDDPPAGGGHVSQAEMQREVDKIMADVESLRGHKFSKPIPAENQSEADFAAYVERELDHQMPLTRFEHYGKVVRKLGLYNGEEIKDFRGMAKKVMTSQAAAYYDPETKKFFVLYPNLNKLLLGSLYAHELTHGLQDQRFDLQKYMGMDTPGSLNEDELFARQAVVEGEATLLMTLWAMRRELGSNPPPEVVEQAIEMQSQMTVAQMRDSLSSGGLPVEELGELSKAVEAMDDIPPYMIEALMGAYMKGMKFVFMRERDGWDKVDEVFRKPPASSEQIIHPEKWAAGDVPVKFEFPDCKSELALKRWRLLDSNTLGEMGVRSIFTEQKLEALGVDAASGWDGDAYQVLMRDDDPDQLMLLLITEWDSEAEAKEFAFDYRRMLREKYAAKPERTELKVDGARVYISEGGSEALAPGLMAYMERAKRVETPAATVGAK